MLAPIARLVAELAARGVPWCHWKSNRFLADALSGRTDLDLLFPVERKGDVEAALEAAGAARFRPVWFRDYPGIEDYLVVDPVAPALIHFHVHFALIVGVRNVKAHRLPWEDEVLATRIAAAPGSPVFIAAHEMELLLLLVRICLKQPHGVLRVGPDSRAGQEFDWLRTRSDAPAFEALAGRLLGSEVAEALGRVVSAGLESGELIAARPLVLAALGRHRRFGRLTEIAVRRTRTAALRLALAARRAGLPVAARRVRPGRGFAVVFLGCDGSGKSSLAAAAARFFGQKLDVERIYFGHGASSPSLLIRAVRATRRRLGRTALLRRVLRVPIAAAIALDKLWSFARLALARRAGVLVICDRFPQVEVSGINDGPQIPLLIPGHPVAAALLAPMRSFERSVYRLGARIAPDLVLKIQVLPGTAVQRKGEGTSLEIIRRKVEVVNAQRFGDDVTVVPIVNDGISIDEAERRAVSEIWRAMDHASY